LSSLLLLLQLLSSSSARPFSLSSDAGSGVPTATATFLQTLSSSAGKYVSNLAASGGKSETSVQ
jgi:hypothetical protein